ncbi:Uncharacterized protein NV38_0002598 [Leptospira kirschneri serovar Mozdok]|nr:Uncharacterized protein NV38_0002598 [Leptospira kirschneri serovar Mozdok]NDK07363.1 hypothetical protein [Leptospira kirschneri serovar Mozdok]
MDVETLTISYNDKLAGYLARKGSVNELSKNSLYHNQPHKYLDFNIKSVGIMTNPL